MSTKKLKFPGQAARAFAVVMTCFVWPVATAAHPIEFHMQPLDAGTVERVIDSLERVASELQAAGASGRVSMPQDAMGVTAVLWALQDALMEADEVTTTDSPSLKRALLSAGYADSYYVVEEWQGEAERVVETWEVLKRGLKIVQVYAGYSRLEEDRAGLSEEQAIERESTLVRDYELLRTTAKDLELISAYIPRLDAVLVRLGFEVRP